MEQEILQAACFTGHRPRKSGFRFSLMEPRTRELARLLDEVILMLCREKEVKTFLCGMADGFDLFAGKRVLALKRAGQIPKETCLIAVLPYLGHGRDSNGTYWSAAHREILEYAQDQFVVSEQRTSESFKKRNQCMVNNSAYVIAYWNHNPIGGTGQTVRMANLRNRIVINLFDLMEKNTGQQNLPERQNDALEQEEIK